ncbi:putative protein kinase RLK-Pelle-SD-2b family [Rosa chinensis]|uniref:non-specific serine/threonine protein kinase n=1 Tax=Rosa chinensis TaxID=74649 RepID=A0A2P6R9K7_ROSCH|nr:putative protein kinase RLK-Pelle-SD-2b family [Rosa chinensis]
MEVPKFILVLLFAATFAWSRAQLEGMPSLKQGNSLKVEEESNFLVSPNGTFSSGFYKVGANASCYSIWFTNSADKTVVWMPNRDKPVSERRSKLTLHGNGNLVLTDALGSVVWSTNTISKEDMELQLLETGNLVLSNQDDRIIWQSFDSPTDTLLPSQPLTKNTTLVSMRGQGTYLSGFYNFKFDDNSILFLIYNGPLLSSVYWPQIVSTVFESGRNPYNSSRVAILDVAGQFISSDNMQFYASDYGVGPKRRLTMDYDGIVRLYSLDDSTGNWKLSWLPDGEFLPSGFEMLGIRICAGRIGQCYPKSLLLNGYRMSNVKSILYVKIRKDFLTPGAVQSKLEAHDLSCSAAQFFVSCDLETEKGNGNQYMKYLIGVVSSFAIIEAICIGLAWWYVFRKQAHEELVSMGYMTLAINAVGFKHFTYAELKKATNDFKQEIGKGRFGTVYKGVLDGERFVAVKRLEGILQGDAEFWAEVSVIGNINHMNLVKLYGFCADNNHKLLVYEYLENGSLDKLLFSEVELGLEKRYKIALGTAKGLSYLHEECLEWVLHCDVKPQNILLDDHLEPKVADFGMSKLFKDINDEGNGFSRVRGTRGYMAPDYGIVLLELLTGKSASILLSAFAREYIEHNQLVQCVTEKIRVEGIKEVIDLRLHHDFNKKKLERLMKVALLCVQEDRSARPAMSKVVELLLE